MSACAVPASLTLVRHSAEGEDDGPDQRRRPQRSAAQPWYSSLPAARLHACTSLVITRGSCSRLRCGAAGYLEFEHEGKKHTLDVIDEDGEPDRYWIMFKGGSCDRLSCVAELTVPSVAQTRPTASRPTASAVSSACTLHRYSRSLPCSRPCAATDMYCERPKAGSNTTHIDFNRAYNPPCAFTPYATCALPPKQNRLPFAVAAGEKIYEDGAH